MPAGLAEPPDVEDPDADAVFDDFVAGAEQQPPAEPFRDVHSHDSTIANASTANEVLGDPEFAKKAPLALAALAFPPDELLGDHMLDTLDDLQHARNLETAGAMAPELGDVGAAASAAAPVSVPNAYTDINIVNRLQQNSLEGLRLLGYWKKCSKRDMHDGHCSLVRHL